MPLVLCLFLMYKPVGYGTFGRSGRTVVAWEPGCTLQFAFLYMYFSAFVLSGETEHQLGRERPTLTAEIADIADADSCFFHDFPTYSLFCRFTGLHESGQARIVLCSALAVKRQKNFISTVHQHNNARFYARVDGGVAFGAYERGFFLGSTWLQTCTAPCAEASLVQPLVQGLGSEMW